MREKKPILSQDVESTPKYFFLDISSLKSVTVKILLMTSSVASFGIYTPMFLMVSAFPNFSNLLHARFPLTNLRGF